MKFAVATDVNKIDTQRVQVIDCCNPVLRNVCSIDVQSDYVVCTVDPHKRLYLFIRDGDRLRYARNRDSGRLRHRATMAVADGVADRDGLSLARCKVVERRTAGVHREHIAAQGQAYWYGSLYSTYCIGHVTHAQAVCCIYVAGSTQEVQGDVVACRFGGCAGERRSYRGHVILRNDFDRAPVGRENVAPAIHDGKRHRFGARSGRPILGDSLVSVSHAQRDSRCQRLRDLRCGVLVKVNPQRFTKLAIVRAVDAANHNVGSGVGVIMGSYAVARFAVVGGVAVVMHIAVGVYRKNTTGTADTQTQLVRVAAGDADLEGVASKVIRVHIGQ